MICGPKFFESVKIRIFIVNSKVTKKKVKAINDIFCELVTLKSGSTF